MSSRSAGSLSIIAALAGCATGVDADAPSASLTANGSTDLAAHVGDQVAYAWSATNASTATSTVTITPTADHCGNTDGPWVVTTLSGSTMPAPLLACQSGFTYALELTVTQASTGETDSAIVTIAVE